MPGLPASHPHSQSAGRHRFHPRPTGIRPDLGHACAEGLEGLSCKILELCLLTHTIVLCAKSDIDILSHLAHNSGMNDLARDPKQIGNLIRRARKKRALSQKALGDKAGLRQETISLIENGNPAARIETLLTVLAVLDLEFQIAPRSKGEKGGYI